ncbi:hypothetical protein RRG08_004013 [Elysia crispata]|uniref:Uncharacterized protein n=1 Tax=Elysia crispata TaxID=231223 RepID=A0AAE1CT25_9GAST|nr:hypothetical protein RRG08_004013 [Elysia crispata]
MVREREQLHMPEIHVRCRPASPACRGGVEGQRLTLRGPNFVGSCWNPSHSGQTRRNAVSNTPDRLSYRSAVLQISCLTERLSYRAAVLQIGCLTDRLSYRSAVLQIGCLTDRLSYRAAVLQSGCLTDRLSYRSAVLQIGCLAERLSYRSAVLQSGCLTDRLSSLVRFSTRIVWIVKITECSTKSQGA